MSATNPLVERLYAAARRFGGEWTGQKASLLEACAELPLLEPATLLAYHDVLLFLSAYPEHAKLRSQTSRELNRVVAAARAIALGAGVRRKRALESSGVAWSESSFAFSWRIARWLAHANDAQANLDTMVVRGKHDAAGARAELDSAGVSSEGVQKLLRLCLPRMEMERLDEAHDDLGTFFRSMRAKARGSDLHWLLTQLAGLPAGDETREQLYDALELPIRFAPRAAPLSRTLARGPAGSTFYHREPLVHDVDVLATIETPLPAPLRSSAAERVRVLDSARGVLATLGRETDVISFAWSGGVRAFALERGVTVVLYAAVPEKRFPVDTHVGFMLFKNGIPAAYGGGWPFAGSCKIGVNVFPAFRGGESAHWFAHVMRVYRQRFAVERFVVEPYQFGAGNREGLLSGAFWFYYRLGFRPVAARTARQAADEFERIERQRGYRTPLQVMRALTRCDLELRLAWAAGLELPWPEAYHLSVAVSDRIAREFAGDRARAAAASLLYARHALGDSDASRKPLAQRDAYASLSLLVAAIPDIATWSAAERAACNALMYAKGAADESAYLRATQRHGRLRRALETLTQR